MLALWAVAIIALVLGTGVLIWAWHILSPTRLHWLTTDQINEVQRVMTGSLLAIVVSDYAKRYFG